MKKLIWGIPLVLIIAAIVVIYSMRPVVKFSDYSASMTSPKELIGKEVTSSIAGMLIEKTKDFSFSFSEEELNNILAWNLDKLGGNNIGGIHCDIKDDQVIFYIDTKVSALSTQVVLKTNITYEEGNLEIAVKKAYLGRVPVPRGFLLQQAQDKLSKLKAGISGTVISIPSGLPEQITVKDLTVSSGIKFKINISVKSKQDLIDLVTYLYDKDFDKVIKDIL